MAGREVGEVPTEGVDPVLLEKEGGRNLETQGQKNNFSLQAQGEEWVQFAVIHSAQDQCCVGGWAEGKQSAGMATESGTLGDLCPSEDDRF